MALASKNKNLGSSIHHKKRYGLHRKHTKPYLSPYWPYIPILIVISLGVALNSLWVKHSEDTIAQTSFNSAALVKTINAVRMQKNESEFRINNRLETAAQQQLSYVTNDYATSDFNSYNPTAAKLVSQTGYSYAAVGENIGIGFTNSDDLVNAWVNKQGQQTSLLQGTYSDIGIGIKNLVRDNGKVTTIIVAIYGQPTSTVYPTSPPTVYPQLSLISATLKPQKISLAQTLTQNYSSWILLIMPLMFFGSILVVFVKHSLIWHKAFIKGEEFIISHPWLDVFIVIVGIGSVLLNRSVGSIV